MTDDAFLRLKPRISLLDKDQKDEIHTSSLEILEKTGVLVHSEAALELLKEAGCRVEEELDTRPGDGCERLEPQRVHPGNTWQFELPYDAPFEFMLSESGRVRRERF